jgi:copper transporter 1
MIQNTASNQADHQMMKMYFHFDFGDTILFKNCVINSNLYLIIVCLIFFLLAVIYEGLKFYRQFVLKKNCKFYQLATISNQLENENGVNEEARVEPTESSEWRKCNLSYLHLYQSFLHVLQVAMSYTLMLGFMTFNVWLCLSILLGAGLGYYLFFRQKLNYEIMNEHCH